MAEGSADTAEEAAMDLPHYSPFQRRGQLLIREDSPFRLRQLQNPESVTL